MDNKYFSVEKQQKALLNPLKLSNGFSRINHNNACLLAISLPAILTLFVVFLAHQASLGTSSLRN